MKKLFALVMTLIMVMSSLVFAAAEEPKAAEAWLLYFASNHEKDSANFPWWPQHQRVDQPASETGVEYTNAIVTGPGAYTVGLKFNWQKAEGAIQFNLIINDAEVLFPGYYVDVTDIRVNGQSIAINENYYGTYHDDTNSGMVPLYNSYWDPFFTPDAQGPQGYRSFDGTPEDATHMVINPDDIVNGDTIEVDFIFAEEAGAAPEELGAKPAAGVALNMPAKVEGVKARLYYSAGGYWPATDGQWGTSDAITVTGEGHYTVNAYFTDQGGWTPSGNGAEKLCIIIEDGEAAVGNLYMGITDVRVDGKSIEVGSVGCGPTGYDNAGVFDSDDTYAILYDKWMVDNQGTATPWGHDTWNGAEGTVAAINPDDLVNVTKVEVDFFLTAQQNIIPSAEKEERWFSRNTVGVAGLNLKDLGIGEDWHNVIPVDTSKTGWQVFTLVSADAHVIGTAFVAVNNGAVTVECDYAFGEIYEHSQCIKWFKSLDEITADALSSTEGGIACGEAVNLDGICFLSINNKVSWRDPVTDDGATLPRYWRNAGEWPAYREKLMELIPAK